MLGSPNNPYLDELDALSPGAKSVLATVHSRLSGQSPEMLGATGPTGSPVPGAAPALVRPMAGLTPPVLPLGNGAPSQPSTLPSNPLPTPGAAPSALSPKVQLDRDRLHSLQTTGSGVSQIHNPILRGLGIAADAIGTGLFPRIAAAVPGTSAHHSVLVNHAQGAVAQDEQQQAADTKDEEAKAQTENIKSLPALHQAQADTAAAKLDLASEKNDESARHNKQQENAQLAQHGYKLDDAGKVVALPYEEMSEPQKAVHDLKASQEELADANSAYKKAQKDNIPLQMEMAKKRIETANSNAGIAAERLGLSKAQFNMRYYGTGPDGQAPEGSLLSDSGKPVGTAFQQNVRPTGSERVKADMATSAEEQLNTLKSIVHNRPEIFGPVKGRTTDFKVWLGSQDPDAQRFRAARTIAGDHLAGTFGGRSETALVHLDNAIGQFKDNPKAVDAGIDQLIKANKVFKDKGTVRTAGSKAAQPQSTGPSVGAVEAGYRFKGGNAADPNSWEKVK